MEEISLILLRLAQFTTAAILLGSSLFFVYGLPRDPLAPPLLPGARRLVSLGALGLAVAAAAGLLAQTAVMAGSFEDAATAASLNAVIGGMALGKAAVIRTACGLAAAGILVFVRTPSRWTWSALGVLGIVATASFAWSGHGATSEGNDFWIHLISDVVHAWAAAAWIGALFVFGLLLRDRGQSPDELAQVHQALSRFATAGTAFVIALLLTGLVNSWYLVGPNNLSAVATSAYGELLVLKVIAFCGMLALAAANRFTFTPRFHGHLLASAQRPLSLRELRRSVAIEAGLGIIALGLVAWFGTLEPPTAM